MQLTNSTELKLTREKLTSATPRTKAPTKEVTGSDLLEKSSSKANYDW